jgi:outer membrane protein OmpA-like peptidoglycan-associated protein
MKLTTLFLIIALIVPFTGCDWMGQDWMVHKDPKVEALEKQVADLNKKIADLAADYNRLVDANRALIAEKKDLQERLGAAEGRINNMELAQKDQIKRYTIKFDNGEFYNKEPSRAIAKTVVATIDKYGADKVRVTVKGYSSHNGPADLNLKVSKARAEGVRDKIYEAYNNGPLNIDLVAFGEGSDNERKVVVEVEVFK